MYDHEFKAALYEEISQIYRYLLKQGANKQDAEDIVQDTVYKYLLYLTMKRLVIIIKTNGR